MVFLIHAKDIKNASLMLQQSCLLLVNLCHKLSDLSKDL